MSIQLTLPDGTQRSYEDGTTGYDVASVIGAGLAKAAVAVSVDGETLDLSRPIDHDGAFSVITENTEEGRAVLRHSAAHVMAQAVLDLFPGATFAIGPPITDGFYYDFDIGRPFTPEDLDRIEARMDEIIAINQSFDREDALDRRGPRDVRGSAVQVGDHPRRRRSGGCRGDGVSIYRNDAFVDLCRGPHVSSTGRLKAVKLMRTAGPTGAATRRSPQLQRIYGTAWENRKALRDVPEPPRRGREAGPSSPRCRTRPLLVPVGPRERSGRVASEGRPAPQGDRGLQPQDPPGARLRIRGLAARCQGRPVEDQRATSTSTPRACIRRWSSTADSSTTSSR